MSTSVRVTDKAYQQLTELRDGGYESLTNALSVAIDRLYQAEGPKEKTMTEKTQIKVEYSADALDNEGVLTKEQVASYADSLRDYITQDYPDAEIEVVLGTNNRVKVYVEPTDDIDHDYTTEVRISADVDQLIADHWQDWIDEMAMQFPAYGTLEVVTSFATLRDEIGADYKEIESDYLTYLHGELEDEFDTQIEDFATSVGQFDSIETWDVDGNKIAPDEVTVRRVTECIRRALAEFN